MTMLIECPECGHSVSDKAISCPACGYPMNLALKKGKLLRAQNRKPKNRHRKLPNGEGSIKERKDGRKRPFIAYPPCKKFTETGSPVMEKQIGSYKTYKEAYDALRDYRNNLIPADKRGMTFEQIYQLWWKEKFGMIEKASSSMRAYKMAYHYCGPLLNMRLSEIHKSEMQDVLNQCEKGYGTHQAILKLFNQIFKYSIENGIVTTNYAQYVKIPVENNIESGEPFTEDDLKMLWEHASDQDVQIALILIYTGYRVSELKEVKINIKERYCIGGLKTKSGKERTVPIHDSISEFLKEFDQNHYSPGTYTQRRFAKALSVAGIPLLANGKKHTPHDCRHTFSWLADKYRIDELSKHMIMGHSLGNDVEKTVYGHRTLEELRAEINKIKVPEEQLRY